MTSFNQPGFVPQNQPSYPSAPPAIGPVPAIAYSGGGPPVGGHQQPAYNQPFSPTSTIGTVGINWLSGDLASYLTNSRALRITQKVELLEVITGWECPNKYQINDEMGNHIFYVGENSNICGRLCCANKREFRLEVLDRFGRNILYIDRDLDCDCLCGLVCPDKLRVSTPGGQTLGYVVQEFSFFKPYFSVQDDQGNTHLTIEGPFCPFSCCGSDVSFKIESLNGHQLGVISKKWSDVIQEVFTDADNFYVSYPQDLHVNLKAVCMAATFLIVSISYVLLSS